MSTATQKQAMRHQVQQIWAEPAVQAQTQIHKLSVGPKAHHSSFDDD